VVPDVAGSNPVDRPFLKDFEPMSFFQALILGLVQGLTEFFPVSSSAHLRLAKWFFGLSDGEYLLYFDLLCHLGTLLALLIYLRKDVWAVLVDPKKMGLYLLALLPLIPAYFLLKPLRIAASQPSYLGYALMITSLLLFMASRSPLKQEASKKWPAVLCIGVMQTIALIPGISRSGSTIAAARFFGWNLIDAARFSFLLAIPTILGGEILETLKGFPLSGVSTPCYLAGFGASFITGLMMVRLAFWIYEKGFLRPIAWYCLAVGLISWGLFHG
jgi:undecaprenyl-diphosphatase